MFEALVSHSFIDSREETPCAPALELMSPAAGCPYQAFHEEHDPSVGAWHALTLTIGHVPFCKHSEQLPHQCNRDNTTSNSWLDLPSPTSLEDPKHSFLRLAQAQKTAVDVCSSSLGNPTLW